VVTLLVFLTVGLGLAAPFVLLCWEPAWLKFMPKPGGWMEHFRTAMGVPMLATAMWLFWFTAPNFGDGGVLWLGLFLVTLAAAAWVWGTFVQRGAKRRGLAIAVSLLLLAFAYGWILEGNLHWRTQPASAGTTGSLKEGPDGIDWLRWSPEALSKARSEGRPVLVDFTAKNCLNCQVNKRTSLEIPGTRAKLKEINAVALLGDFSNADPLIAGELRRYNRPGVPLVLVYPRDAAQPPIVLPEILTPTLVLDALAAAAK
jgi:thiol:disulfide interchange protein DsbD